jgi:hypothetical protein
MRNFRWSQENEVFLAQIDAEHRDLFRIAVGLQQAVDGKATAAVTALQEHDTIARSIHRASMGTATTHQPVMLDQRWSATAPLFTDAHHPCLGSGHALPYSAHRGKQSMSRQALEELKQQIPLLDYLQAHDWRPA